MKCLNCGAEVSGNFCQNCGASVNSQMMQNQQEYINPMPTESKKKKKKKPFYKRFWFILLVIIAGISIISGVKHNRENNQKIDWSETVLGNQLPTPNATKGKIWTDTDEKLDIDFNKVSESEYKDYVSACKKAGYTIDAESTPNSYKAYNKEGNNVYLDYLNKKMSITLNAPMKFSTIQWPSSKIGKLLPIPKSNIGNFSHEHDTGFLVYINKTSQADFNEYVSACAEKGFNVDYSKDEKSYSADNADEYHILLKYEGNNIMSVDASSPNEDEEETTVATTTTTTATTKSAIKSAAAKVSETLSQKNAVRRAEDYLDFATFSKKGLIEQLEYEKFSTADAEYAVNKLNIDWNEQAVKKAQDYLDMAAFSKESLIEQLEFEGFTKEQATYGAEKCGF